MQLENLCNSAIELFVN